MQLQTPKEENHEIKTKIYSFVSDIDVKNPVFNVELVFLINNF